MLFLFYRLLMKFGANVNQQTKSGDTPCHLAAYRGYSLIVQLLVEGGASLRVVNNKCRTPLEDAQSRGHTEIVRYISAVNKIRKYSRNLSKISPICMYFKKNYLLYFFGILLIIWLSESLIHSFIQLFGYLFDFKKTNFLCLYSPGSESYRRTDWESQITSSMQKMHMFPSDNGNGYYWAENPDHFSVQSENNLSLLSHKESPSKMTFRNL